MALGRAARTDAKVKVRQPLRRALLLHPGVDARRRAWWPRSPTELNVKVLEDVDTLSGLMSWTVVPNFRALGPRLGPRVNEVKAALAAADGSELQAAARGATGSSRSPASASRPTRSRCGPTRHEAFALAEDGGWAVALDLELDDDLRREGLARELVRSLNDLRKEIGLAVSDRVAVAGGRRRARRPTPSRATATTWRPRSWRSS